MKSSGNSREDLSAWGPGVRSFGVERYGTLKSFAEALGMTPQNLNGYLNGERRPGRIFIRRLSSLGFDISTILHPDTHSALPDSSAWEAREEPLLPPSSSEPLDWVGIEGVIGRKLEDIAHKVDATPAEVATWKAGAEPRLNQMAKLLDLVVTAAIGARAYAKMLSEIEAPTAHPAALPAGGATIQSSQAA